MATLAKWIIGAVIGVILVLVTFIKIDPNNKVDNGLSSTPISSVAKGMVTVTIEGQVAHPGTYTLDENLTVTDLVLLAGGYLSSADLDAIDDSLPIKERTLVYVPLLSGYSQSCVIDPDSKKINVNTATSDELKTINGISETIALRIISYREENGDFTYLEELMKVSGIGTKTYEKIRDYITLK